MLGRFSEEGNRSCLTCLYWPVTFPVAGHFVSPRGGLYRPDEQGLDVSIPDRCEDDGDGLLSPRAVQSQPEARPRQAPRSFGPDAPAMADDIILVEVCQMRRQECGDDIPLTPPPTPTVRPSAASRHVAQRLLACQEIANICERHRNKRSPPSLEMLAGCPCVPTPLPAIALRKPGPLLSPRQRVSH
ncbi:hypothetical protein ABID25_000905 [Mesorhizobium abyssinicae]